MMSWQQKWQSICSKLETCRAECRTAYRSDQKCKDSIEAVVADLWHFMDWLEKDPATAIPRADLHAFIQTPEAFNIRGCADLATLDKHFEVSNPYRDDTRLTHESVDLHGDGHPLPFGAVRGYGNGNIDRWEDAVELAIRAAMEWERFLVARALLPGAVITRGEPARSTRRFHAVMRHLRQKGNSR